LASSRSQRIQVSSRKELRFPGGAEPALAELGR
jgi:hypothetical protein